MSNNKTRVDKKNIYKIYGINGGRATRFAKFSVCQSMVFYPLFVVGFIRIAISLNIPFANLYNMKFSEWKTCLFSLKYKRKNWHTQTDGIKRHQIENCAYFSSLCIWNEVFVAWYWLCQWNSDYSNLVEFAAVTSSLQGEPFFFLQFFFLNFLYFALRLKVFNKKKKTNK